MSVDWTSGVPAHEQVAAVLRARVKAGEYAESGKLPHRDDLAAEFDVSHATITKATALLRDEGLVVYAPGRGLLVRRDQRKRR
jgi:GntR family transcriptional regulator